MAVLMTAYHHYTILRGSNLTSFCQFFGLIFLFLGIDTVIILALCPATVNRHDSNLFVRKSNIDHNPIKTPKYW